VKEDFEQLPAKAKPFLKWAGGKGRLLSQLNKFYPKELLSGKIDSYIEPFIGGGAVFFDIIQNFKIKTAYISDLNDDLILVYKLIQEKPNDLCILLQKYQEKIEKSDDEDRQKLFYETRQNFNNQKHKINYNLLSDSLLERAAQLIYLNKTCFNGLFRLNSKSEFNVPYGKYKNPLIFEKSNILSVSLALQAVDIRIANYLECFDSISSNSFVYFDPPYKPISETASFTNYSGKGFDDEDQLQLATFFRKIDMEKKAKIMLSNSDPKNEKPEDDFFEKAYLGYNINKVDASRAINCNGAKRGKIKELLITNY
jgi:DNA adenine methylase